MLYKDTREVIKELRTIELSDEQLPLVGLLCDAAETIESLAANLDKVMEERDKLIVERDTLLDRLHEASATAEVLDLAHAGIKKGKYAVARNGKVHLVKEASDYAASGLVETACGKQISATLVDDLPAGSIPCYSCTRHKKWK